MPAQPLPTDRATLEAMAAELVAAERAVAERIATAEAILLVRRQRIDPRFQSQDAQAHLEREFGRLRAKYSDSVVPALVRSGPHLVMPPIDQCHAMEHLDYLRLLYPAIVRLQREVIARLAKPVEPKIEPKAKRKRGETKKLCVGLYFAALAASKEPPSAQEIADEIGCDRATAWLAIKPYEVQRTEAARNKSRDDHDRKGGPKKMRNK